MVQKKRSMSVRMSPSVYKKLLKIQRYETERQMRQVTLNEVLCNMILYCGPEAIPKLKKRRSATTKPQSMSVRMSPRLYDRLVEVQLQETERHKQQLSMNEVVCQLILNFSIDKARSGAQA